MYSFSQNFEDVYIYRAFREVNNGFYIDAGAFDPVVDSVTKMLYDLGWSGINIEPGPSFSSLACRVRDINLPYALTSIEGETVFHYNPSDPGTSTTSSSNLPAESASVQSYQVNTTTLQAVVRDHAPDRHIHFLKLDIEGGEWEVLQSTDWLTVRPELIIAESCLPYTNQRRDTGWAEHMMPFGYQEVFFDGINTYYLRDESMHRCGAFQYPVNVLDGIRKFDPYQNYSLGDDENSNLIKNISQEVSRVVEAESSIVRDFLETDLGPKLQAQEDLVAKLTSEQSEHFSRLRSIASDLSEFASAADHNQRGRGGNSIEAVIGQVAQSVSNLVEQRHMHAAELILAQEAAEDARAALREKEKSVDEARAELRRLVKRLTIARASRTRMLELTERVVGALEETDGAPDPGVAATPIPHREPVGTGPKESEPNPLTRRITRARTIPAWRRLVRFRHRALVRRADAYRDSGRFAEAAEAYARSYALRPSRTDLCLQMANMLTQLRTFELAEEAYLEALAKAPNDGLILLHFGHMLELSGRSAEAQSAYLNSAKLIRDHPDVVRALNRTKPSPDPGGED